MDLHQRGSLSRAVLYDVTEDGQEENLKNTVLATDGKVRKGALTQVVLACRWHGGDRDIA
jgi:hypothetical protein